MQVLRATDGQPSLTVVRTLQDWANTSAGFLTLTWDGRSDTGDPVRPGTYGIRAQSQNLSGGPLNATIGWVAVT